MQSENGPTPWQKYELDKLLLVELKNSVIIQYKHKDSARENRSLLSTHSYVHRVILSLWYFLSCFLLPFLYTDEYEIHPLKSVYVFCSFMFMWAFFLVSPCMSVNFGSPMRGNLWRQALVLQLPQRVRCFYVALSKYLMWICKNCVFCRLCCHCIECI